MKVPGEFNYRHARAVLSASNPGIVDEIISILGSEATRLELTKSNGPRDLSKQLARYFTPRGWRREAPVFSIPDLRYDLLKSGVPLELEIGHNRLAYADFFKFMADHSQGRIPAGVMVVTNSPTLFGHTWHNSLTSTRKKLEAVSPTLFVPILVIAVDP
jgi:hypothetical protein